MSKTRVHWRDETTSRQFRMPGTKPPIVVARCGAWIVFHRFARTVISVKDEAFSSAEAAYTKATADLFLRWQPKPPRRKCPGCMHVAEIEVLGDWGPLVETIERAQRRAK